ncbi:putative proteasome endopeptidase complex [Helianthus annuus]|nr:putative proteasome endopeptidase complex [Helianthus annuus]
MVSVMKVEKAPLESYADIGGLDAQIQEIKVAVELPLTHPELYEDIGIKPPKGVILYGEPGTCKTLLAKAVANSTLATFLRVVGSELIQKYLGDGPKLVRELFRVAITYLRLLFSSMKLTLYDAHSGGEREIQRTMLELLNQLDGFDSRGDVKVILDRKIEFPLPAIKTRRRIFYVHCHRFTVMSYIYSLNLAYKNHKMPILAVKILKILIALAINPCLLTKTDLKECFDC